MSYDELILEIEQLRSIHPKEVRMLLSILKTMAIRNWVRTSDGGWLGQSSDNPETTVELKLHYS